MHVLVTGASGYIGHKLCHALAAQGHQVHALVRSEKGRQWLQHPNITSFLGDVVNIDTLRPAMKGCRQVYHAAAKVGAWTRRPQDFYDVNVGGTLQVLNAAAEAGAERLVFTSTAGVFGPAVLDRPVDEQHQRRLPFRIDYDRSKKEAEEVVAAFRAVQTVIVNPAKVFGPGHTSHSLTTNALIASFLKKGVALIPAPGTYRLSFTYIDDVVQGHLLAMEKGRAGERYILGGNNVSYFRFFDCIRRLAGTRGRILAVPKALIKGWALLQAAQHQLTGADIRFSTASVDHLFSHYIFSSSKAIKELQYAITPLETAVRQTLHYLKTETHA